MHLLADVDAEQRRHRDAHVARFDERLEVLQEQRAQQRRDVLAVGIRVREDADLVVAQPVEVRRAGIDAERDADVVDLLRREQLGRVDFPGIQDLAAQRHHGLILAVARLLRGAAGRIALDEEQLGHASAPGSCSRRACRAAPGPRRCACARPVFAAFKPMLRVLDRELRDRVAGLGMLVQPQREVILDERRRRACAHSRDESRSFVCPENCGSSIFTDSTKLTPSQTSSGASLMPRGKRLRNSQNSRSASRQARAQAVDVRAALRRRNQVHVALEHGLGAVAPPDDGPLDGLALAFELAGERLLRQEVAGAERLLQILLEPARVDPALRTPSASRPRA